MSHLEEICLIGSGTLGNPAGGEKETEVKKRVVGRERREERYQGMDPHGVFCEAALY